MSPSPPRFVQIAVGTLVAAVLVVGMVRTSPARSTVSAALRDASTSTPWAGAWGTAVQPPLGGPNWSKSGFEDQTVRQVIRLSTGGAQVRIRLSNLYGTRPLHVDGATLGRSAGGGMVWPKTLRNLTFDEKASVVIPAGREAVSDSLALPTSPLERLTISLQLTERTGQATFHRHAMAPSYRAQGNHLSDQGADAFTQTSNSWYYLSGVEVAGAPVARDRNTVVAFGDALVDGVGSTAGADRRFPDHLAERLAAAHRTLAVTNAGIGDARLLNDSDCGGEKGLTRFRRDVLDRPGVRSVIVSLGANDIGAVRSGEPCMRPNPPVSSEQLIAGHRALVRAARAEGVKAIGVTIPPMKGALVPYWSPEGEKVRQEVNHWIRTSGTYDSVADADHAMAAQADAQMPRSGYVYMDGAHPNDAGHLAIAGTVDLDAL
ncbi:GDSL-type esterase/lipase family protein [Actinomadura sp. 9N407]|uniref:GDSL-type esterase/lipase family protein n=1 Tax=Actinomadura sp. 9N407 TaxID=3375154 RepID=UPI0037ADFE8E